MTGNAATVLRRYAGSAAMKTMWCRACGQPRPACSFRLGYAELPVPNTNCGDCIRRRRHDAAAATLPPLPSRDRSVPQPATWATARRAT